MLAKAHSILPQWDWYQTRLNKTSAGLTKECKHKLSETVAGKKTRQDADICPWVIIIIIIRHTFQYPHERIGIVLGRPEEEKKQQKQQQNYKCIITSSAHYLSKQTIKPKASFTSHVIDFPSSRFRGVAGTKSSWNSICRQKAEKKHQSGIHIMYVAILLNVFGTSNFNFSDKFQEERGRREGFFSSHFYLASQLGSSTWPFTRQERSFWRQGSHDSSWPYLIPMWAWISVKVTMLKWRCVWWNLSDATDLPGRCC